MRQQDKFKLEQKTRRRQWLTRLKAGYLAALESGWKKALVVVYLLMLLALVLFRQAILPIQGDDPFDMAYKGMLYLLFPFYSIGGLLLLFTAFGTPFGAKVVHENLLRIGLCNHAGEAPVLVAKIRLQEQPHITVLEFEANGIPRKDWEDKRLKIESALNLNIAEIRDGKDRRRMLVYTTPAQSSLPQVLHWKDSYIAPKSFVLVFGESLAGQVTVNLAQVPHILLGGSTGSGKSLLLKLLVMQCVQKGAEVYTADFKGGVDFPPYWHRTCRIIIEETALLGTLTKLVMELEQRKKLLRESGCANIDAYNRQTGCKLPRMVFACDEVAEVLDKNGLSKQDKELVAQIESKLSVIARQGRAFGIHLILATQRPDANILSGQIRNNIDCRVCGRADNVLSQIILDNTSASEQIPKHAQGRFINQDGTVFQGYLFDESKAFAQPTGSISDKQADIG